jgi:hypothetical protein
LARPIHIKHDETVALAIYEAAQLLASAAVLEEIVLENLAERITARTIDSGQKATEGGSMWQLVATKECHEWTCKRGKPVKEGFEGGLATHRIAEQDGDEIQYLEGAGPSTGEAHPLSDRIEIPLLQEMPGEHHNFGEPRRN